MRLLFSVVKGLNFSGFSGFSGFSRVFSDSMDVSGLRVPYSSVPFLEKDLVSTTDPMKQFIDWFQTAIDSTTEEQPNAACLSTCTLSGYPSSRMLLIKKFDEIGFTFYSNYDSRKGIELAENPKACLLFFWSSIHRQVRIEGTVDRITAEQSDQYYDSRPVNSKISASISCQSTVISNREEIETLYKKQESTVSCNGGLSRPSHWGGYILKPLRYEFWQGQTSRLHDRIVFIKQSNDIWTTQRLAP